MAENRDNLDFFPLLVSNSKPGIRYVCVRVQNYLWNGFVVAVFLTLNN